MKIYALVLLYFLHELNCGSVLISVASLMMWGQKIQVLPMIFVLLKMMLCLVFVGCSASADHWFSSLVSLMF
jgi:hypothetical protein